MTKKISNDRDPPPFRPRAWQTADEIMPEHVREAQAGVFIAALIVFIVFVLLASASIYFLGCAVAYALS